MKKKISSVDMFVPESKFAWTRAKKIFQGKKPSILKQNKIFFCNVLTQKFKN